MTCDLSNILPDIPAVDDSSMDEIPGQKAIDLSPANGHIRRVPPDGCVGCVNEGNEGNEGSGGVHKCWKATTSGPRSKERLWSQYASDPLEVIRDWIDMLRTIVALMDRQAHGVEVMVNPDVTYTDGGPPSSGFSWKLVSCLGGTATMERTAGSADPRALGFGGGTVALKCFGLLTFNAPSQQQWHGGVIVYAIDKPSTWSGSETLRLHYVGACGNPMAIYPIDSEDVVTATYTDYFWSPEQWPRQRHHFPFPVKKTVIQLSSPVSGINNLIDLPVVPPQANWFSASWSRNGVVEDKTAAFTSRVKTIHVGVSVYRSYLDLTGISVTNVASVTITVWAESSADDARFGPLQNRCANAIPDPSRSWGAFDDGKNTWYCGAAKDSPPASLASSFRRQCFQTTCSRWTPETGPTSIADSGILNGLHSNVPWIFVNNGAGFFFDFGRRHCPSLFSLATTLELPREIPYNHWELGCGGWFQKRFLAIGDLSSVLVPYYGYEWLEGRNNGAYPNYANDERPDLGPAGGNFDKQPGAPLTAGSNAGSDADDPSWNRRAMAMTGSVPIRERDHSVMGAHIGKYTEMSYQSTAARYLELWYPNLLANGDAEEFPDGTFQSGFYDANGIKQLAEDGNTVYYWRLIMSPRRRAIFGGNVASETIAEATDNGDDTITLYMELSLMTISRDDGMGGDIDVTLDMGGNFVALPEWARIRNRGTALAGIGVPRLARNGDCIKFDHPDFAAYPQIFNRKFMIRSAKACADPAHKGSFGVDYATHIAPFGTRTRGVSGIVTGSLPTGLEDYGENYDRVILQDENDFIGSVGMSNLASKTVSARNDPVAHYLDFVIRKAQRNIEGDGASILGDCMVLAANGDVWGQTPIVPTECLIARARFRDANGLVKAAEFTALRTIAERLMGGD